MTEHDGRRERFDPVRILRERGKGASVSQMLDGALGLLKGLLWLTFNRLRGRRINGGKWLRVYGHAYLGGPGALVLGRGVVFNGVAIRQVSLHTLTRAAQIRIDDNVTLNGTAIVAQELVHFQADAIAADAYIVDTQAHRLSADRRDPTGPLPRARPVIIGSNAWLSALVVVLEGVHVGQNSVVGACSLVRDTIPPNVLAAGNPCVVIRDLPELEARRHA